MAYVWNSGGLPLVFFLCSVTVECEREHRVFSYCIRLTLSLYFMCFVYVVDAVGDHWGTVNPLYINTTTNRWEESVPFSSNNILLTLVMLSCKVCAKMLTVVLHIWKKLPIFKWSQMNLCTVGSGIGDCDMPKFFCRQCQVMRTPSLVFSSAWLRWKVSLTLQHLKQMLKRVEVSQPRLDGWKIMLQRRNNIFPCY